MHFVVHRAKVRHMDFLGRPFDDAAVGVAKTKKTEFPQRPIDDLCRVALVFLVVDWRKSAFV